MKSYTEDQNDEGNNIKWEKLTEYETVKSAWQPHEDGVVKLLLYILLSIINEQLL